MGSGADRSPIFSRSYGSGTAFMWMRAPSGLPVSRSLLQRNRDVLERRLRDLGLLVGVNDAESMKRLRPLFERAERT